MIAIPSTILFYTLTDPPYKDLEGTNSSCCSEHVEIQAASWNGYQVGISGRYHCDATIRLSQPPPGVVVEVPKEERVNEVRE